MPKINYAAQLERDLDSLAYQNYKEEMFKFRVNEILEHFFALIENRERAAFQAGVDYARGKKSR